MHVLASNAKESTRVFIMLLSSNERQHLDGPPSSK